MECVICKMWQGMPHIKMPTTPTTIQDTESALVIGYWLGANHGGEGELCKRHANIVRQLGVLTPVVKQPEVEKVEQPSTPEPTTPALVFHHIKGILAQPAIRPVSRRESEPFVLTGPLLNENTVTTQPPLPGQEDLAAPYIQHNKPGTVGGAIEAAKAPPVEGAHCVVKKCQWVKCTVASYSME
jgi:hypothetical protein